MSSSFTVLPVKLNGSRRLDLSKNPKEIATTDSLLDIYAQREKYQASAKCNLNEMNFLEFATKYKIVSGKLVEQSKNIIPRVFPTYSTNSKSPTFWLYCKYQLLRYKPWTKKPENAWGNTKENEDVCISECNSFLETEYAKTHVPDWHNKLEHIQSSDSNDDESSNCTESPQREEWMILADFSTLRNISDNETGEQHDWQSTTYPYTSQEVSEMPSWINSKEENFFS